MGRNALLPSPIIYFLIDYIYCLVFVDFVWPSCFERIFLFFFFSFPFSCYPGLMV